jgi:hypothetical protein
VTWYHNVDWRRSLPAAALSERPEQAGKAGPPPASAAEWRAAPVRDDFSHSDHPAATGYVARNGRSREAHHWEPPEPRARAHPDPPICMDAALLVIAPLNTQILVFSVLSGHPGLPVMDTGDQWQSPDARTAGPGGSWSFSAAIQPPMPRPGS